MTTFITNGLLGFNNENDKAHDMSEDISFKLNGLLASSIHLSSDEMKAGGCGNLSGVTIHLISSCRTFVTDCVEAELVPSIARFSTNGLLSSNGTNLLGLSHNYLMETLHNDFSL